jgi:hypothetical protein
MTGAGRNDERPIGAMRASGSSVETTTSASSDGRGARTTPAARWIDAPTDAGSSSVVVAGTSSEVPAPGLRSTPGGGSISRSRCVPLRRRPSCSIRADVTSYAVTGCPCRTTGSGSRIRSRAHRRRHRCLQTPRSRPARCPSRRHHHRRADEALPTSRRPSPAPRTSQARSNEKQEVVGRIGQTSVDPLDELRGRSR